MIKSVESEIIIHTIVSNGNALNHGRKVKYRNNISVSCFDCGSGPIGYTLRRNEMGTDSLDMHGIYARRRER